jgi:hypothetical protein
MLQRYLYHYAAMFYHVTQCFLVEQMTTIRQTVVQKMVKIRRLNDLLRASLSPQIYSDGSAIK